MYNSILNAGVGEAGSGPSSTGSSTAAAAAVAATAATAVSRPVSAARPTSGGSRGAGSGRDTHMNNALITVTIGTPARSDKTGKLSAQRTSVRDVWNSYYQRYMSSQ